MKYLDIKQTKEILKSIPLSKVPKTDKKCLVVCSPFRESFKITFVSSGIYKFESLSGCSSERRLAEKQLPRRVS
jgi:hypothetical protein